VRSLEVLVKPKLHFIVLENSLQGCFYNEYRRCTLSCAEPDGAIFQQTNALSSETLLMTFVQRNTCLAAW